MEALLDNVLEFLVALGMQGVFWGVALNTGLAVLCFTAFIWVLYSVVPPEDRTYMDPLPPSLKFVWPFIQIFAYYVCTNFNIKTLERVEKRLERTGVSYMLTAEQFTGLRFVTAILAGLLAWFSLAALGKPDYIWIPLAVIVGFLFPEIWLNDSRKRREKAVIRALPVYLDFITMAVEAGLNFTGALGQSMDKGPKGALRNEFAIVLRDLRAGLTRAEALRRMVDRLDMSDITSFVSAIVQAEKLGSSMAAVLRIQSEQRRNERFQRAEKQAMEAPVKLIFPLIAFIFPVTFIVLGFPIVMKFFGGGVL